MWKQVSWSKHICSVRESILANIGNYWVFFIQQYEMIDLWLNNNANVNYRS